MACYRYIELNPVRAAMVKHPRFYRWSSYRSNAEGATSSLVTPHEHYRALGGNEAGRRLAYRALFKTDRDPEVLSDIRAATNGNYALGSQRFQDQVAAMLGRRVTYGKAGRPPKDTPVPRASME